MTERTPSGNVRAINIMRETLLRISALRGYQGEDIGRVAGYRVAAEMAEDGIARAALASAAEGTP